MHELKSIAAGLLLALAACLAGAALAQPAPVSVEKPAPKPGDARSYVVRDLMTKVHVRDEDTVVTLANEERTEVLDRKSDRVSAYDKDYAVLKAGEREYTPAAQFLRFPLEVGKRWEHGNSFQHASCGKHSSTLKSEVIGWEEVKVPAGSFQALRIDSRGHWRNSCSQGQQSFRFWYVPQLRWLARSEITIDAGGRVVEATFSELTAYKLID